MQRERVPALKIIVYVLFLLFLFVVETTNGLPMRVFGYRVDILPFAVVAIALLDGPTEGASMGFVAGVLYDMAYTTAEGMYPLYYLLIGIGAGMLGHKFLRRIYPSVLLLGTVSMLVLGLWRLLIALLLQQTANPLLFIQSICGQTLVSAAFSWAAYLPVRTISRRFVSTRAD